MVRNDFSNLNLNNIVFNWEAFMGCGRGEGRGISGGFPSFKVLKLNADGASQGKPEPAGIGVHQDFKGEVMMMMFSIPIGIRDLEEAEVWPFWKPLKFIWVLFGIS